jgi:hypothetical protein
VMPSASTPLTRKTAAASFMSPIWIFPDIFLRPELVIANHFLLIFFRSL